LWLLWSLLALIDQIAYNDTALQQRSQPCQCFGQIICFEICQNDIVHDCKQPQRSLMRMVYHASYLVFCRPNPHTH
jgi:hypothetical protein